MNSGVDHKCTPFRRHVRQYVDAQVESFSTCMESKPSEAVLQYSVRDLQSSLVRSGC